ncbi:uncharacterized protein LOC121097493 isoform X3 [Falco naumanni]|uniref:uncharacterized protein LOC121097493 isoform X3 n=1 Tax=Falco naumanni TaxID=148594 RepID=UPI001ADDF973|nr:uncharacterized protein LOC121097493 isoform X3 [Falco naumanni]
MSPALSLLLSLASCTLLWGMPLPPRDVRLEAQNFHVHLRWEPDPGSPSGATYQVEWRRRTSPWTKADTCGGNSTGSSWACELYFDKIHDIYWARVRAVAGGKLSKWASSSELQLYRDTIVGPPKLSWLLQGHILTVPCKRSREEAPCTFRYLKPSTQYCIRTAAVGMAREQSREAEQCLVTPADPAGFPWVLLAVLSGVFLLLGVAGLCFIQLHIFPSPSEMHLPKTLQALPNKELNVPIRVSTPELEEDSLTLLLQTLLPSHVLPAAQHAAPTVQLLVGESISQGTSGYCANGFGPDCHEGRDTSCTHSQPGHADASQVGEVSIGAELEQPMPVGLTRDSYTGDRDYGTSETWLSLQSQFSSKCRCPALEAGSCLPLPTPGRGFSQEDLRESLGIAGHWVPLSSVKLPASEEEDGGQHVCALQPLHGHGTGDSTVQPGNLEQAALDVPLPCSYQLPQLPPDVLQAAPFSGYEPHPPADGEP